MSLYYICTSILVTVLSLTSIALFLSGRGGGGVREGVGIYYILVRPQTKFMFNHHLSVLITYRVVL